MDKIIFELFKDSTKILLKASFNTLCNLLNCRKELSFEESYKILNIKNTDNLEKSFKNLFTKDSSPYLKNIIKNAYLKIKENK